MPRRLSFMRSTNSLATAGAVADVAAPIDAAPEPGPASANASQLPVRRPIPTMIKGLQRGARSLVSHFGLPTENSASGLAMNATAAQQRMSPAQLDAAIHRWAQTQVSPVISTVTREMKRVLHINDSVGQFRFKRSSKFEILDLKGAQLTSFPPEMGQAQALQGLYLNQNRLTSFPAEMGQAQALQILFLSDNQLSDLPKEIAQLTKLRFLDLDNNRFAHVPRALLELPSTTEINLSNNPLPDAEILAVRAEIAQRLAEGKTVPQLIMPGLEAEAGELREAVANGMNVHTGVLTNAFKKRLDAVALQFPEQLQGSLVAQRAEMTVITQRLTTALEAHAHNHPVNPDAFSQARGVAHLMFQKGQGHEATYVNDFQHSAGHVLAYTFLAMEAQWANTPKAEQAQAKSNGMTALIQALKSGSGECDTRLCEEVMQTIGLPLSDYAQAHPDIIAIKAPQTSVDQSRDVIVNVAKNVLRALLEKDRALTCDAPPAAWRAMVVKEMETDHPKVLPEQIETNLEKIESAWQTFHEQVEEKMA